MWYEVYPCRYKLPNAKKEQMGLYIHRRKTNTFVVLDKDMKPVSPVSYIVQEDNRGRAFFNLNPKWLPYQH